MTKPFDLEPRTEAFARDVRAFIRVLPKTQCNLWDIKQLVRASGSVGANFIEAREAVSQKDFLYRVRVSRKEAKEAGYWLRLLDTRGIPELEESRLRLVAECQELIRIMTAIIKKCELGD